MFPLSRSSISIRLRNIYLIDTFTTVYTGQIKNIHYTLRYTNIKLHDIHTHTYNYIKYTLLCKHFCVYCQSKVSNIICIIIRIYMDSEFCTHFSDLISPLFVLAHRCFFFCTARARISRLLLRCCDVVDVVCPSRSLVAMCLICVRCWMLYVEFYRFQLDCNLVTSR